MSTIVHSNVSNLVSIQNGKPATTSKVIADTFGKRHADVIRAVKNLECTKEFNERNYAFIQIDVNLGDGRMRQDPAYSITKDGFMFLAMGFTGKEAAKWKEQFITAFNTMESELLRISNESKSQAIGDIANPKYYQECRAELFGFIDSLPKEHAIPINDDVRQRIADGYLTDVLMGRRWLVSFGSNGIHMQPIKNDESIMRMADVANVIKNDGAFIADQVLADIASVCLERIVKKNAFYKAKQSK